MACDSVLANTQSEMCSPETAIVDEILAVICLIWWAAVWVLCCTCITLAARVHVHSFNRANLPNVQIEVGSMVFFIWQIVGMFMRAYLVCIWGHTYIRPWLYRAITVQGHDYTGP